MLSKGRFLYEVQRCTYFVYHIAPSWSMRIVTRVNINVSKILCPARTCRIRELCQARIRLLERRRRWRAELTPAAFLQSPSQPQADRWWVLKTCIRREHHCPKSRLLALEASFSLMICSFLIALMFFYHYSAPTARRTTFPPRGVN